MRLGGFFWGLEFLVYVNSVYFCFSGLEMRWMGFEYLLSYSYLVRNVNRIIVVKKIKRESKEIEILSWR